MTIFTVKIFSHKSKHVWRLIRIPVRCLQIPWDVVENIDMKMIRPVKSCGSSLIFDRRYWTLLQSCNVVNPGKYSTRIPVAHHQFCPKLCIVMNFWTTSICLPRQYLIVDSRSSFQGITQNLKIRKPLRARDYWLLHQSKICVPWGLTRLSVFTP